MSVESLDEIAAELEQGFENFPDCVSMISHSCTMNAAALAIIHGDGLSDGANLYSEFREMFEPDDLPALAQFFTHGIDFGTEVEPNKRFALEVANSMTHDQAQALYRFAVLVTKLV